MARTTIVDNYKYVSLDQKTAGFGGELLATKDVLGQDTGDFAGQIVHLSLLFFAKGFKYKVFFVIFSANFAVYTNPYSAKALADVLDQRL